MDKKSLTNNICKFLISLNLLVIICLFLPMFTCNVSKTIAGKDKNLSIIRLIQDVCNKKIVDIQIITFVIICAVLFVVSLVFVSYLFNCIKRQEINYKKSLAYTIFMFLVSFLILIFVMAILKQNNVNELLAITGEGSYTVGVAVYIALISTILQIILSFVLKRKGNLTKY